MHAEFLSEMPARAASDSATAERSRTQLARRAPGWAPERVVSRERAVDASRSSRPENSSSSLLTSIGAMIDRVDLALRETRSPQ